MKLGSSGVGWLLALAYVAVSGFFIVSQGLFGESFIALILGMPWSLLFAYVEYGGAEGAALYVLVLVPIALNAALLYWLGSFVSRRIHSD